MTAKFFNLVLKFGLFYLSNWRSWLICSNSKCNGCIWSFEYNSLFWKHLKKKTYVERRALPDDTKGKYFNVTLELNFHLPILNCKSLPLRGKQKFRAKEKNWQNAKQPPLVPSPKKETKEFAMQVECFRGFLFFHGAFYNIDFFFFSSKKKIPESL